MTMEHHSSAHEFYNPATCHLPNKLVCFNDFHTHLVKKAYLTNDCSRTYTQILKDHFKMLYFHPVCNI